MDSSINIGLIGFMGTGKSVVGRVLADSINRQFFDTDTIVEKRTGRTITQIFENDGEEAFREIESDVVEEVCRNESTVISFGGGVVLSSSNVEAMRKNCVIILLRASTETIIERTKSTNARPLLNNEDAEMRVKELLASRSFAYENAKDFAVDTDNRNTRNIVDVIRARLEI